MIDRPDDARLAELAVIAAATIEARLRAGDDPRDAVQVVVRIVFGADAQTMCRTAVMLADPATIDRIAAETLGILAIPCD